MKGRQEDCCHYPERGSTRRNTPIDKAGYHYRSQQSYTGNPEHTEKHQTIYRDRK
jgi:hypothetical protein